MHSVPDRAHGYCVDDNARALLLACALNNPGEKRLSEVLTARFAAFVQHAWNPDTRRFRNFMGFNRTWLEDRGSEDSHGRTLWALGECARKDASPSRRRWAAALFAEALPTVEAFGSPRALAFTLLGLDGYCAVVPDDRRAREIRHFLADRLMSGLASVETPDWTWFEEGLAYDNARLPQALMLTGMATQTPDYVAAGLRSLRWLMTQQTASTGHFRPVGTAGFGELRQPPRAFDQQPVEATATIAACLTAWRAEGDAEWKAIATNVFAWFLGRNDLSIALVDPETGSCRDGLHPDRANENRGGESVVSYLLGLADIRQLARVNVSVTLPGGASRHRRLISLPLQRTEGILSQATFLHRQALYLRPDPARVIVRPFKPATEPRDLNPTDKTRANHIVERVLALDAEGRDRLVGGRAGELSRPASQPAGDVRASRRRDGRGAGGTRPFSEVQRQLDRRLFPERIFVRGLGAVQSQHRAAS